MNDFDQTLLQKKKPNTYFFRWSSSKDIVIALFKFDQHGALERFELKESPSGSWSCARIGQTAASFRELFTPLVAGSVALPLAILSTAQTL